MLIPKKIDFTEDSKAKFLAETIARHFTEEVMNMPKPEKPASKVKAS